MLRDQSTEGHATEAVSKTLPLKIVSTVFDVDRCESSYEVEFSTVDGERTRLRIARDHFGRSGRAIDILLRAHADLPPDSVKARQAIKDAVALRSGKVCRITCRPGRHADAFVYPGRTYGSLKKTLLHRAINTDGLGDRAGKLRRSNRALAEAFDSSDYLLFGAAVSAASVLLGVLEEDEGAIFHLHGVGGGASKGVKEKTGSSSGKTLTTRLAASRVGRCQKNHLITFAITERALEEYLHIHNELGAFIDEEGRADRVGRANARPLKQVAYLVAGGRGAVRSAKAIRDAELQNLIWRTFGISSGEMPLDDLTTPVSRAEGEQLRMISIPVPPGGQGGVFNRLEGAPNERIARARELAKRVEDDLSKNFGLAIPHFLRRVYGNKATMPLRKLKRRTEKLIEKFVERTAGRKPEPWERRFAIKFAIVYAAAHWMAKFGTVPWSTERALAAVEQVYRAARGALISIPDVTLALLKSITTASEQKRLFVLAKGRKISKRRLKKAAGFVKNDHREGRVVLLTSKQIARLGVPEVVMPLIADELRAAGMLIPASDGKWTRQVLVPTRKGTKRRRRFFCISAKNLSRAVDRFMTS